MPNIRLLKEQNVREGFFEYDEVSALVGHLPEYLREFVWFGYYSGWRRGEIAGLEWRAVDLQARVLRLRPERSKTSEGRVVGDFRKAWATACVKAGLYKIVRGEKGTDKKIPAKIFYDQRLTTVRGMIRAGVPERVAMAVSGHKTREIFDRYNIVNESDLRDALRKTHLFRTNATKTPQSGVSEDAT